MMLTNMIFIALIYIFTYISFSTALLELFNFILEIDLFGLLLYWLQ